MREQQRKRCVFVCKGGGNCSKVLTRLSCYFLDMLVLGEPLMSVGLTGEQASRYAKLAGIEIFSLKGVNERVAVHLPLSESCESLSHPECCGNP